MGDFLRALSLLTRLPVRARWDDDVLPGRAMAAYPLVGAVIGVAAGRFGLAAHRRGSGGCKRWPAARAQGCRPC